MYSSVGWCVSFVLIALSIPAMLEGVALVLSSIDSFYLACGYRLREIILLDMVCNTTFLAGVIFVLLLVTYGIAVCHHPKMGAGCFKVACVLMLCLKLVSSVVVVSFSIASLCSPACVAAMGDADGRISFSAAVLLTVGLAQGIIYLGLLVFVLCRLNFWPGAYEHLVKSEQKFLEVLDEEFNAGHATGWQWSCMCC
jgi:hypothetical protein